MKSLETEEQYFEELAQYIRKALFPHELKVLDDGLALRKTTLIEYLLIGKQLNDGDDFLVLKSNSLPEQVVKLIDVEEVYNFTDEEKIVVDEFGQLITFKIVKIVADFIAENISTEAAIEFSKNSLENLEVLHERFEEELDGDKIKNYIVKRKKQIQVLEELNRKEKNNDKKLIWNERYDLMEFSIALQDKEIIGNHLEFVNIFKAQNICTVKKKKIDFFVVLIYELIYNNPDVILSGKKSGKGVLSIIDQYFRDDSTPVSKKISFRNRHNRFYKKGQKYDEIKSKAVFFLKNHLNIVR